MKYENFAGARFLVEQIDDTKTLLKELDGHGDIHFTVNKGSEKLMSIGAWSDCEHDATPLAIDFLNALISHYEKRLSDFMEKLEKL